MLYNIQKLKFQVKAIGDFVQRRTVGSFSFTDHAIR